jgi:hypothetical protein
LRVFNNYFETRSEIEGKPRKRQNWSDGVRRTNHEIERKSREGQSWSGNAQTKKRKRATRVTEL